MGRSTSRKVQDETNASQKGAKTWFRRLISPGDVQAATYLAIALVLMDAILSVLIVFKVPYTEIDWEAYMSHISLFRAGERDYSKLIGGTGPCVYPGGYIYIYTLVQKITGGAVFPAQILFLALYLATLATVLTIYVRAAVVPPWALCFLCLSKRLHSIYMLRLFNDCFAMLFAYLSILSFQSQGWMLGLTLFSIGVSVKMNVLLMAPSLFLLMLQTTTLTRTTCAVALAGLVQLVAGLPFLVHKPWIYIKNAFNLGRRFLYIWSVNFKFLPEDIFLSATFAAVLLAAHLLVLLLFAERVWCKGNNGVWRSIQPGTTVRTEAASPERIATVLFTANLIGVFFSRSLHYQFYSWYFHMLPLLLWKTNLSNGVRIAIWTIVEFCWNIYPSTFWSSLVLFFVHGILLVALWRAGAGSVKITIEKKAKKRN